MSRSSPVAARTPRAAGRRRSRSGRPRARSGRARRGTPPSPRRRAGARRGRRRSRPRSCMPWAGCRGRAPRPPRRGRRGEPVRDPGRRAGLVHRHPPAERVERRPEGLRRRHARPRGRDARAPRRRPCAGSVKSSTRPSAWRIAKASGTGVRAMSEPRTLSSQAMELGSVSTAAARSRATRPRAISPRLSAELAPGERVGMRHDRPGRRRRLVGPDPSTRFATRTEPDLPRPERLGQLLDLLRGVQPGIEAEPAAAGQRLGQPVGRLVLGMRRTSKRSVSTWPCTCSR